MIICGNDIQQGGTVRYIFRDRPDLIERGAVGNQPVTGNRAVGRLHPGHSAEGTGLADGSAGIRTQSQRHHAGSNRGAGASRRSSRYMPGSGRILCGTEGTGLCCASHGKFIHVGLSDNHHSCFFQTVRSLRLIRRDKIFQYSGGTGCFQPFCADIVLYGNGNTGQRSCQFSCLDLFLYFFGLPQGTFLIHGQKGVNFPVFLSDFRQSLRYGICDPDIASADGSA